MYLKFNWIVFAKDGNSSEVGRAEVSFGGTDSLGRRAAQHRDHSGSRARVQPWRAEPEEQPASPTWKLLLPG